MDRKEFVEILGERPEELLEKRNEENRAYVQETGREPREDIPPIGIGIDPNELREITKRNFYDQLDLISNFQTLSLFMYAEDSDKGTKDYVSQPVDAKLDLPTEDIISIYKDVEDSFGVGISQPLLRGSGQDPKEAYMNIKFGYSFDLEPDTLSFGLKYSSQDLELTFTTNESSENLKQLIDILKDNEVLYNGFYAEEKPREWIMADPNDSKNLERYR